MRPSFKAHTAWGILTLTKAVKCKRRTTDLHLLHGCMWSFRPFQVIKWSVRTFSSLMSPSSCTISSRLLSCRADMRLSSSSFLCLQPMERVEWSVLKKKQKNRGQTCYLVRLMMTDMILDRKKLFVLGLFDESIPQMSANDFMCTCVSCPCGVMCIVYSAALCSWCWVKISLENFFIFIFYLHQCHCHRYIHCHPPVIVSLTAEKRDI